MKNKLKHLIILLLILGQVSCDDKLEKKIYKYSFGSEVEYYNKNGLIERREFFSNDGIPISVMKYERGKISNVKVYDGPRLASEYSVKEDNNSFLKIHGKNGIAYGEGKLDDKGREIGWWTFYDKNKKLSSKENMIIENNQSFRNQTIVYNAKGQIDSVKSHFVKFDFKKEPGVRTYLAKLRYNPKLNKNSNIIICLGDDFKSDFSNADKVKLDTLSIITKKFMIAFKKPGKKVVRGVIIEQYKEEDEKVTADGKTNFLETKTYFEETLHVD